MHGALGPPGTSGQGLEVPLLGGGVCSRGTEIWTELWPGAPGVNEYKNPHGRVRLTF